MDKLLTTLFPPQSIESFIQIIFMNMRKANKMLVTGGKIDEDDKDTKVIKEKTDSAREMIKKFLGEYLSRSKEANYDILESFMKGVVFETRYLRESYL